MNNPEIDKYQAAAQDFLRQAREQGISPQELDRQIEALSRAGELAETFAKTRPATKPPVEPT